MTKSKVNRYSILVVLLIVLMMALRVLYIAEIPPAVFIDEYNLAVPAAQLMLGKLDLPINGYGWYATPALFFYYVAVIFSIFGISTLAIKIAWLMPALLTVLLVYVLSKHMFNSRLAGLISLILLGLNVVGLHIARWGHGPVIIGFLQLVSLTLVWLAHQRKDRLSTVWMALAALCSSLSLYMYVGARAFFLFTPMIGLWYAYYAIGSRKVKLLSLITYFSMLIVGVLPLLATVFSDQFQVLWRMQEVSIIDPQASLADNLTALGSNTLLYSRALVDQPDFNLRHNPLRSTLFPYFFGLLVPIGLLIGLFVRHYRKQAVFLIIALLATTLGGLLSVEAPSFFRTYGAIPFLTIAMTIPFLWVDRAISESRFRSNRKPIAVMLVLVLLMSQIVAVSAYFSQLRPAPADLQSAFTESEDLIGRMAHSLHSSGNSVYLDKDYLYSSTIFHALPDDAIELYDQFDIDTLLTLQNSAALILEPSSVGWANFLDQYFDVSDHYPVQPNNAESAQVWVVTPKQVLPDSVGLSVTCQNQLKQITSRQSLGVHHTLATLPHDAVSCQWNGKLTIVDEGQYLFRAEADDSLGMQLVASSGVVFIDQQLQPSWLVPVQLTTGVYDITIDYQNTGGAGSVQLDWRKPGMASFEAIDPMELARNQTNE